MKNFKLDFSQGLPQEPIKKQEKKKKTKYRIFQLIVFCLLAIALFYFSADFLSQGLISNLGPFSFWQETLSFFIDKDEALAGKDSNRINILLLGVGGQGHEGPYLTDTMILLNLEPSSKKAVILSIPRDLYVPIENNWHKINFAYALGMSQKKEGGEMARSVVENVFDIPVHYWAAVDFKNFVELIDWLGGLSIDVQEGFVDYSFPGPNYSYRTVKFEPGVQLMSGERVLEYVRSRHGDGENGSDFARSRRQQQVLMALKEKIEQTNLLGIQQIWYFYNFFTSKIKTNLTLEEALELSKLISPSSDWSVKTFVLSSDNLLKADTGPGGAYILRPRKGNFEELAYLANHIFEIEKLETGDEIRELSSE